MFDGVKLAFAQNFRVTAVVLCQNYYKYIHVLPCYKTFATNRTFVTFWQVHISSVIHQAFLHFKFFITKIALQLSISLIFLIIDCGTCFYFGITLKGVILDNRLRLNEYRIWFIRLIWRSTFDSFVVNRHVPCHA